MINFVLYRLIWDRFVASQMAPAILDTVTVDLKNDGVCFRANGSQVKFPGFMKVYIEGTDDQTEEKDQIIPELEVGDKMKSVKLMPKQHFTQPPPRYTEARLVKTLGRTWNRCPSTYAPTLDTIQRRGYVHLMINVLFRLSLAKLSIASMLEFFPEIIDIEFTAKMEADLDNIEEGQDDWIQHYRSFL